MDISLVQYVTIRKASEITGYSEDAIRTKISRGIWLENREWKWAPDGVQLIDIEGYNKWAKRFGKASQRGKHTSSSTSDSKENGTSKP